MVESIGQLSFAGSYRSAFGSDFPHLENVPLATGVAPQDCSSASAAGVGIANNIGDEVMLMLAAQDCQSEPALMERLLHSEGVTNPSHENIYVQATLGSSSAALEFVALVIGLALVCARPFTIFSADRRIGVTGTADGRLVAFGVGRQAFEHLLVWVR